MTFTRALFFIVVLTSCAGQNQNCTLVPTATRTVYGEGCSISELPINIDWANKTITCAQVQVSCPISK